MPPNPIPDFPPYVVRTLHVHGAPTPADTFTPNSGVRRRAPPNRLERNLLPVCIAILDRHAIVLPGVALVEEGAGNALQGGIQTLRVPTPKRNASRRSMKTDVPALARTAQLMEHASATIPEGY